jgi:hypothetical protein
MHGKPAFLLFAAAGILTAQMTTSQWDNARTSANLNETILTPRGVASGRFGKLSSIKVDGDVYAQPLYVPNVPIPGKGVHNVLYIATEHDSVYAFDAPGGSLLWHISFLKPGSVGTLDSADVQCPFIHPEIGITSTPVIDLQTGTLYILARTRESRTLGTARFVQRLHALAITTGVEKFGGPVELDTPGFDGRHENPRAGLLLANDQVIMTWGSSCDVKPYNGWVMAYDKRTLKQSAAFNTSPGSGESGIWQADMAPAADNAGNIYFATGNGNFRSGSDYGDSVLRLHLNAGRLNVQDFFTPSNQEALNLRDADIGSGGPLLLPDQPGPHPHLLLTGGKNATLYVLDRDRMGRYQSGVNAHAVQTIHLGRGIYSAPAYWNGHVFMLASNDLLSDFKLDHGRLPDRPTNTGNHLFDNPGATPAVSANGGIDGIVWVLETKVWNDYEGRPAVLFAYDASDVSHDIYRSSTNPRDEAGNALRFVIPTVVNGHVYVGTKGEVDVYGLRTVE